MIESGLMMEKTSPLLHKSDSQFLRSFMYGSIILTTARCSNILSSRASGAEYIIDKGELFLKLLVSKTRTTMKK